MKSSDFKDGKEVGFNNVEVMWAKVFNPDTFYEPAWKVDLVLTEEDAKEYKEAGFNVRELEDGKFTLQAKRKCQTADGTTMRPPEIVGRDAKPFTQEIGNGSICNFKGAAREYKPGKCTLYLNALQVLDHVEYSGGGSGFEPVE